MYDETHPHFQGISLRREISPHLAEYSIMRYEILSLDCLLATVRGGYTVLRTYDSNHKELFIINQYTNIHRKNYQMLPTKGDSMCQHPQRVCQNNKSNKVGHKSKLKMIAQRMVVLHSPSSHHISQHQITVVVCFPNTLPFVVAVVAGLLVQSHHSPNSQSSPIPLVTVNVLSAQTVDVYCLCVV